MNSALRNHQNRRRTGQSGVTLKHAAPATPALARLFLSPVARRTPQLSPLLGMTGSGAQISAAARSQHLEAQGRLRGLAALTRIVLCCGDLRRLSSGSVLGST